MNGKSSLTISNETGSSSIVYDVLGRVALETDSLGNIKTYEYNAMGKIAKIKLGEWETIYEYQMGGLLYRITYPDQRYEIFSYDKNCNLVKRENERGDFISFVYDSLNRIIEITNSFSQKQSFEYDALGHIIKETDALGRTTGYVYSPGGKLTSILDPEGNRTEYGYDQAGRLASVFRHEGDKKILESIEEQGKNAFLQREGQDDTLRITRYQRNLMGDVTCIINALGEEENFSYDLLGRLTLKKDREGYETIYSYTEAGDLQEILYADGSHVEYTYNSLRQLIQVKDALGVIRIETDSFGRAAKVTDYDGNEVRYQYGSFGERKKTIYPDGRSLEYQYDKYLRLTGLISGDRRIAYAYDPEGRLSRKDRPGGISSIYTYDGRGFLNGLCHMKSGVKLEEYTYEYDLLGNKTKIARKRNVSSKGIEAEQDKEEIIHGLWQDSAIFHYQYDNLNRLMSIKKGDQLVDKYVYDAFGNRISWKKEGMEIHYTYDVLDRLIKEGGLYTSKTYEYDKRGNLVGITDRGKKIQAYEYDVSGRLGFCYSFLGKARSYTYDGLGNRVGLKEYEWNREEFRDDLKKVSEQGLSGKRAVYEEKYILDRTRPYHNLLQQEGAGRGKEFLRSFLWDFNAVWMEEAGREYVYLQDELGSPIRLLEMEGEDQMVYGYDAFGKDTFRTQGRLQPFGYTGYQYDPVGETCFAQAREYMPGIGRFAGEDWLKGDIGYPFTLNAYG